MNNYDDKKSNYKTSFIFFVKGSKYKTEEKVYLVISYFLILKLSFF